MLTQRETGKLFCSGKYVSAQLLKSVNMIVYRFVSSPKIHLADKILDGAECNNPLDTVTEGWSWFFRCRL